MKKIAFTLYALGLLILLPLVVVFELNRKPVPESSVQNTGSLEKDNVVLDEAYASKEILLFETSF
jgi:hypothetical protein